MITYREQSVTNQSEFPKDERHEKFPDPRGAFPSSVPLQMRSIPLERSFVRMRLRRASYKPFHVEPRYLEFWYFRTFIGYAIFLQSPIIYFDGILALPI